MIERLDGFAPGVAAFAVHGRLSGADYRRVVEPAVEAMMRAQTGLRLYCEVDEDFRGMDAGALVADFRTWLAGRGRWERIALVCDVDWIRYGVSAFKLLMPGRLKVFVRHDRGGAKRWIEG